MKDYIKPKLNSLMKNKNQQTKIAKKPNLFDLSNCNTDKNWMELFRWLPLEIPLRDGSIEKIMLVVEINLEIILLVICPQQIVVSDQIVKNKTDH